MERNNNKVLVTVLLLFLPLVSLYSQSDEKLKQSPWKPVLSAKFKETYDSNLYWLPTTSLANRRSAISLFQPQVGFAFDNKKGLSFGLSYAPELAFHHDEPEEDYQRHIFQGNAKWKYQDWTLEGAGMLYLNDGSDESVTWPRGAASVPVMGNPEARNRRDHVFAKHRVSARHDWERFFIRAVTEGMVWDFMTQEKASAQPGGFYQNFYDRHDVNGGVDLGLRDKEIGEHWLGVRYGSQFQGHSSISPSHYDNEYVRLLYGIKAQPFKWLKLEGEAGPDFRMIGEETNNPGFGENKEIVFSNAKVVFLPGEWDTITISYIRLMLPSSGGNDLFEDVTSQFSWKRKLDVPKDFGVEAASAEFCFKIYENDFSRVARRDFYYQPGIKFECAINKNWSAALDYNYTWSESDVPGFPAREFERHQCGVGVTWKFE